MRGELADMPHQAGPDGDTAEGPPVSKPVQDFVQIPSLCFIRKPGDTLRCTRSPQHAGDHAHFYAGVTNSRGIRPNITWPRREGESQAD